jgi:hypothetical protein
MARRNENRGNGFPAVWRVGQCPRFSTTGASHDRGPLLVQVKGKSYRLKGPQEGRHEKGKRGLRLVLVWLCRYGPRPCAPKPREPECGFQRSWTMIPEHRRQLREVGGGRRRFRTGVHVKLGRRDFCDRRRRCSMFAFDVRERRRRQHEVLRPSIDIPSLSSLRCTAGCCATRS